MGKGVFLKKKINLPVKIIVIIISLNFIFAITHTVLLRNERKKIVPNGILSEINGHKLHIYIEGETNSGPALIFMSGGATPAPVFDFKQIYSLFSDEYRIIVIERFGYGYSEVIDTERDIDIVLEETRSALQSIGENGSFILFPHSVSGLEALYWLSKYPNEIAAIIGLDMGFPEFYLRRRRPVFNIDLSLMSFISMIGIHRVYYPIKLDSKYFTEDEYKQAKYLRNRNFMNISVKNELRNIYKNAEKLHNENYYQKEANVLLFSSSGKERGDLWISSEREFANKMDAELVILECDHYVHHFESQKIMEETKMFLKKSTE